MWFRFPGGSESCSIEGQSFSAEFESQDEVLDSTGKTKAVRQHWFRAPDHFAPKILGMNLGYFSLPPGERPEACDVDDLTPTFGAIGTQIGEQAQVIESLKSELMLANETIQKLATQQRQAETEVQILRARNADLEKENSNVKARIADFESEQETREALAKANKAK